MNKKTYLGLVLATCMGVVSAPLWAEVVPAPEHPANITAPAESPEQHTAAAALHKEHATHHKSVAAGHGKTGQKSYNY